jgi:hypothetical protein
VERDPSRPITGAEALGLYEANWRHVEVASLSDPERALIQQLADRFGRGLLLTTNIDPGPSRQNRTRCTIRRRYMVDFKRPEHQAVAAALRIMDHDRLVACQCWFEGGTGIVLDLGEYRLNKDIDRGGFVV